MTVPVPGSLTYTYLEDGVTTVFSYPVRFLEATELVVIREAADGQRSTLVYNTDYTVSGAGNPSGGSVTRTAVTSGGRIIISRSTGQKQLVDLKDAQRNPAEAVELQLDRLAMVDQDLQLGVSRALKIPLGASPLPKDHFPLSDGEGGVRDGGSAADIEFAQENAAAAMDAAARAEASRQGALAAAAAIATAPQWAFADKTAAALFNPVVAPDFISVAGEIYNKVITEPGHAGKVQIGSGAWYELNTDAPTTRMFGGGTGTPSTDGGALEKLIAYVAARGLTDAEINIERGTYLLTKGRSLPSKNHWKFNGSVLDFTGVSNANLVLTAQGGRAHLACEGSVRGALPALSTNVSRGDFVVPFVSAHGLAPNDVFQIYNPTDNSWSGERTYYRAGELCRVMVVVDATNVWVDRGLYENYAAADVTLSTFDTWSGSIEDVHVIGNGLKTAITYGVVVDFAKDVTLQNVSSAKVSYNTHTINRTIDFRVDGCRGAEDGTADFGGDYGFGVYSSQRGLVTNSHFIAARHAITHGNIDGSVPFRDIHYRYCSTRSTLTGQVSWDFHSIGDLCSMEYCTSFSGLNDGVKNLTVRNCRLHNLPGTPQCYIAGNQVGGTTRLIDNTYVVDGVYTPGTALGIIHLANSTSHTYLRDDKYYDISGVNIRGNGQRSKSIVAIWTANAVYAVSVAIVGIDDPDASSTREQVLHAHGGNGSPIAAKYYVVDDIRRLGNGVAYALYSNGMSAPTTCKYPSQNGYRSLAGTSGAAVTNGSPTTFRHPYPETPDLITTCGSRLLGGDVWQASSAALSGTGFTPVAATTDGLNFANTNDGTMYWQASLQRG